MTTGPRRATLLAAAAVVAAVAVLSIAFQQLDDEGAGGARRAEIAGLVVDETGRPLPGAAVDVAGREVTTDARGRFRATVAAGPRLVSARAEGHLPRTQAVVPGTPTEIRLTAQAEGTVSLRFGGDVMFGRRFYDRDEDGDRRDGLLPVGASVQQHAALLDHVQPLLEDADVTVVNLETAIVDDPWFDPSGPRPAELHPTKDFVLTSAPEAVPALRDSGVDVVSLGNNHVYDALGPGLDATLAALDAAGLLHVGAGRTVDEAWAPALVERRGQTVAFLACTTVVGLGHEIGYVASETQGGAAGCEAERLDREVRAARERADTVVVMIHGGTEYQRVQSDTVRGLTGVATAAGATLVVNGHPHVVGGITTQGPAVVADATGNLLFDQTVWPTLLSYLLRVDVRAGVPVLTTADPILIADYVPRPTVGLVADSAARKAAGVIPGPARLAPPGAVLTGSGSPAGPAASAGAQRSLPVGAVARLATGWWVDATAVADATVTVGEDLLFDTGSFEDVDTDRDTDGAALWTLGDNAELTSRASCSSSAGVELRRSPVSTRDVVAAPRHRQLVSPGARLTLLVSVRDASPGATAELRWYEDTSGPANAVSRTAIPVGSHDADGCQVVRLDAVVPDGVVAAQPFLRLTPPADVQRAASLRVDDVRLVAWADPGESGRRYDTVEAREEVTLRLTADAPPQQPAAADPLARVWRPTGAGR